MSLNSSISTLLELSKMRQARKLVFGLQVNIDKANNRLYDVGMGTQCPHC